jgi:signal transduction histidine kinase
VGWLSGSSIGRKLTRISVLSSVTALLTASVAFLFYDFHSFRQYLASRIATEAEILGFNCVSPLVFKDAEAATDILGGLKAEPSVLAAVILDEDGRRFAGYSREGEGALLRAPAGLPLSGQEFGGQGLLVSAPIQFEGRPIGRVLINAELRALRDRQWQYAGIVAIVLAASFVLALALGRRVEKTISGPILDLAATARRVSEAQDYSVRAHSTADGELGALVSTFNEMLDRIERQNADLEQARDELERRVEARTRELAASNRELEAFSYSVSHDLRAPLRAIDGFSKALLDQCGESVDEKGRHYLNRVRAGTRKMGDLIDDLLGLARLSRKPLVRQRVDLTAIAQRVGAELAGRDGGHRLKLAVEAGLSAHADSGLVEVVLENLMGNAWKFSSGKDDAIVRVGRLEGPRDIFYVRDNGAGFDMRYADKLFGAFQRLHSDAEFEGTGIGLATVQRVVNRHGGRAWAEAEPGKGATFYFTLEGEA